MITAVVVFYMVIGVFYAWTVIVDADLKSSGMHRHQRSKEMWTAYRSATSRVLLWPLYLYHHLLATWAAAREDDEETVP